MKLTISFFAMIFIATGSVISQPKLSLNKPEIDLGIMYSGMKKQGIIILKNIGTDTLRIFSITPTCGCTAVKKPKEYLAPNESDTAEVEFNSTNYHMPVTKYISIVTNDPTSQNISVKLTADVRDELQPVDKSTYISFGNVRVDTVLFKEIVIKNISDHRIKIKGYTTSTPSIKIKMDKNKLNPNDTFKVELTFKTEKAGYCIEHFTLETDSKNQPFLEIRATYIGNKPD